MWRLFTRGYFLSILLVSIMYILTLITTGTNYNLIPHQEEAALHGTIFLAI